MLTQVHSVAIFLTKFSTNTLNERQMCIDVCEGKVLGDSFSSESGMVQADEG